jgi:predicted TIM-barrel fold metal-dependent hydrolase
MPIIDGDSHFMEPFDLFERYCDPAYRQRVCRIGKDSATGERMLLVDERPMSLLDVEELLGALVGYGQKEAGRDLNSFDRYAEENLAWQDMDARVRFLDAEGFDAQVIYPSMGLLWEGSVEDPALADALCRGYNTWAFELCSDHRDRLYPAAHISLRDAGLAVAELERVAKLGARTVFVPAMPVRGGSLGHPNLDPIWAAAQDLDLSVSLHLVGHPTYTGHQYYRDAYPGFMFVTMNVIQDPRMALTTMVYDGVFERFPRLRVATIEAMVGWVGEWLERLNYRFSYMKDTSKMMRPADEYFARNIWVCGDPEEKMFPHIVRFAGDEKFFFGSDYPHAEGFLHPIQSLREALSELPEASVERIVERNAAAFFRL